MEQQKHNDGIDLLRIVAMMMIVTQHVLYQGGILTNTMAYPVNYRTAWLLELACYGSVNCYAMISGYVGLDSRHRLSSLGVLWLRTIWYTLGITALLSVFMPGSADNAWLGSMFPVLTDQYWYLSCYIMAAILVIPINEAIRTWSARRLGKTVAVILVLASALPRFFGGSYSSFLNGFSVVWLLVMYLLGAWLKKADIVRKVRPVPALAGYMICLMVTWGGKMLWEQRSGADPGRMMDITYDGFLVGYTSFTVVGCAAFLLLFFAGLPIGERMKKGIRVISPLSFSVYLIHCHPLVVHYLLMGAFSSWAVLSPLRMTVYTGLTVLGIYAACTLIDWPREVLFRKLELGKKLSCLEERFFAE